MGDKCDESKGASDPLYVASRSQANFAENVPLILAVALLAELNGANRYCCQSMALEFCLLTAEIGLTSTMRLVLSSLFVLAMLSWAS